MSSAALDTSPLPTLPPRQVDSHKGDFGRVLIIGGSQGMAGAAALAGIAALRSGAGLVTVGSPSVCQSVVSGFEPSMMTVPLDCDQSGRLSVAAIQDLEAFLKAATAVAIGPGIGQSDAIDELVVTLYTDVQQPLVVDADALNALARHRKNLGGAAGPRILTPHPGEFARLAARERIPSEQRIPLATEFARQHGVVLVLKGHRTVITDGARYALNATGNPGMATGGTGDTLTGITAALLAQHFAPYDAARLACHVHGLAGDIAASELGQVSLIASDLIKYLPTAWQLLSSGEA